MFSLLRWQTITPSVTNKKISDFKFKSTSARKTDRDKTGYPYREEIWGMIYRMVVNLAIVRRFIRENEILLAVAYKCEKRYIGKAAEWGIGYNKSRAGNQGDWYKVKPCWMSD